MVGENIQEGLFTLTGESKFSFLKGFPSKEMGIPTRGLGTIPGSPADKLDVIPEGGYPDGTIRSWQIGDHVKKNGKWVAVRVERDFSKAVSEFTSDLNQLINYKVPIDASRILLKILGGVLYPDSSNRQKSFERMIPEELDKMAGTLLGQKVSFHLGWDNYNMDVENVKKAHKKIRQILEFYKSKNYGLKTEEEVKDFKKDINSFNNVFSEYHPLGEVLDQVESFINKWGNSYSEMVKFGTIYLGISNYKIFKDKFASTITEKVGDEFLKKQGLSLDTPRKDFYKKIDENFVKNEKEVFERTYDKVFNTSEEDKLIVEKDSKGQSFLEIKNNIYYLKDLVEKLLDSKDYKSVILGLRTELELQGISESLKYRLKEKTNKDMKGNIWDKTNVINNIENISNLLPKGNFLNNKLIEEIHLNKTWNEKDKDFGSSYYNKKLKLISITDLVLSFASKNVNLEDYNSFQVTFLHEIGHAVAHKMISLKNINYKKFVVACGWDNRLRKDLIATGNEKPVNRTGRNEEIPLITKYAHVSPQEAFAENYSFYFLHKKQLDSWLDGKNKLEDSILTYLAPETIEGIQDEKELVLTKKIDEKKQKGFVYRDEEGYKKRSRAILGEELEGGGLFYEDNFITSKVLKRNKNIFKLMRDQIIYDEEMMKFIENSFKTLFNIKN